ncbi:hypothetical protein CY34DRAFT_798639 [Suillus luteus UH-Slu-Lm8-n1]|uniref:Uncharacterized protein n=1 Tax=Suillus luteus UH-Slu-Lm8-n1 TaxID=930992 RepID=A0A0D0B209_9AGAM|nr:hypothetical protein CY34DRAFT_798639 [Suillus luteus UH-Slu-Lm8-n1]
MLGMMLVSLRRAQECCRACGDLIKPQQSEPLMTDTIDGSYSFDNEFRYIRGDISLLFRLLPGFLPHRAGSTLACRDSVYHLSGLQVGPFTVRWIGNPSWAVEFLSRIRKNANLDRRAVLSTQRFGQNHVSNI